MAGVIRSMRLTMAAIVFTLQAGCAAVPQQAGSANADSTGCRGLFQKVDAAVAQQGVRDNGPAQIPGFPYLRADRLLASFRNEVDSPERFAVWTRHLASLDAEARGFELSNLRKPVAGMDDEALTRKLDSCREQLIATELTQPEMQKQLRETALVPDAYIGWRRAAGLYPVTSSMVSSGIEKWHDETRAVFATPLDQLPVAGKLTHWMAPKGTPLERTQVENLLNRQVDPLGLPTLTREEQQRLFDTFAPIWEVDVASDDDYIGMPYWSRKNILAVNLGLPVVYTHLSHTRFNGKVLLQLNYIVWFPARGGDDMYAGPLDGINWRVTLGPDGTPWLYDVIHNCGCYYMAFPSTHLKMRSDFPSSYFEKPLQPQTAPTTQPVIVRIAHATHYIQRIYSANKSGAYSLLAWHDYDELRAMPSPGGTRSLFGKDGIVESSVRSERYMLWPTGVRSPGAMRQWGQHAIAFVGQRHFDDAYLLDTLFVPTSP